MGKWQGKRSTLSEPARDARRRPSAPGDGSVAVSPVLIAAALVWWLVSPGWAIVLLVAALVAGGWSVLREALTPAKGGDRFFGALCRPASAARRTR